MNTLKLFENIVLISIMGSILAIGILLIKSILGQKLSAKFHYYIWFLLLLRLLIPLNIGSPLSILNLIPPSHQNNILDVAKQNSSNSQISNINSINNNAGFKLQYSNTNLTSLGFNFETLVFVWLIGACVILIYILVINILLWTKLKNYSKCDRNDIIILLEQCKSRLKINSKVPIIYYKSLKSPMLSGIIHPKILISSELVDRLSEEELKFVFMHELSHIKRRDLLVNVVCIMIQAIYWFNPIIWCSIYKMKQDCEISCDATVLTALNLEENKKYGHTIIKIMEVISKEHWIPGTIGFASKYNKRRIIMITLFKKASIKWTCVAVISLIILLGGCLSLTISSSKNKEAIEKQLTSSNIVNESEQDTTKISGTEKSENLNEAKQNNHANSFVQYINLLGLSKEKLLTTMNENPNPVDEGGLEFEKAGIRVWFNYTENTTVSQIFTQRTDIDFNGAKIGDSIDKFKMVLGEPISDKNGDMHFKYKDAAFISVIYDSNTNEVQAVYFLKENF
ncbi:M56 family metallopeptidase [Clostridium sp. BL-8]|uniref:M56 family metallopeptidase n=1 Tax=Clostridium sp. BL-8 TaxID=349938 RepID=UPI00325C19F5